MFLNFLTFLIIPLCGAGHYIGHPVFSVLCHVFCQLIFLRVFRNVFVGGPRLHLPETPGHNDFAQMSSRFE